MNVISALIVGIVAELLVVAQAVFAYKDKFFFVWQMKEKGFKQGVPFVWHGGMWGDFFIISPLLAAIVWMCSSQWNIFQVFVVVFVGLVMSLYMHIMYANSYPSAHSYNKRLTIAGALHFWYMAGALAVLGLFYFCTPHISLPFLYITSVLLAVHLFFGTHIPLGLANFPWYDEMPKKSMESWITNVVVWAILLSRCTMLAFSQHTAV